MERSSTRLKLLALLVVMMFAALSTRLWFLQVLAADQNRRSAANNGVRVVQTESQRGRILDDKGHVLVGNRPSLEILVNRQRMATNPEAEVMRLSQLLGESADKITAALNTNRYYIYQPVPVAVDVSKDIVFYIGEHPQDFPGVTWRDASVRDYPYGELAAHILGTVGAITAAQQKQKEFAGYGSLDTVGQSGLELVYERYLQGVKGQQKYQVNSAGVFQHLLGEQPPQPGDDVKLYLDAHIQQIVEDQLYQGLLKARNVVDTTTGKPYVANAGAVIVMDPRTFGVKAIASWPTFDPSWFVGGLNQKQQRYLFHSKSAPLFDRAVQAIYATGSAFKPFIALSALHNGVASLSGSYDCPAQYAYPADPSHPFHNWDPVDTGYISLATAIKISCDTVFYQFGAAFYDRWRRDPLAKNSEPLQRDLHGFGFGRPAGIDLPSQATGLIPDAAYALKNKKIYPDGWVPAGDILMSIGQGQVAVSPLQLATAFSAIANGGKLCQPRLAQDIQTESRHVVKKISAGNCHRLPYTEPQISYVRDAMQQVTKSGGTAGYTFAGFDFSKVSVGGKTGTAQRPPFQDTSWFAALVGPVSNPDYVIVAMVEQAGHGSTTAAPIVRSIIERMYGLSSIYHVGNVVD